MTKCTTIPVKSCGLCLAFLLSVFTIPTFADNQTLGDNPQCDNTTLHATTGSVTLNANWTENTIRLNWEPGENTQFSVPGPNDNAYSCTYNGGITLPDVPTRSGYTFGGWRVSTATQCVLIQHDPEDAGIGYGYINDSSTASYASSQRADQYGLTEDNTWAVEFFEGIIKGRAICSGLSGNNHDWNWRGNSADWTSTESALLSAPGEKKYCWCAGTDLGNSCHVASPSWIFNNDLDDSGYCAYDCAQTCAEYLYVMSSDFRRAIFGLPALPDDSEE